MDAVFTVAVGFSTHDDLKNGLNDGLQFAAVLAPDAVTAMLIAAQMVACHGVVPTSTVVIAVVE